MTIKGSHLFSYQRDAVDEALEGDGTNKKVVILARRQCGKSLTICNLLLYVAINRAGSKSILLSPTFKQAKKIYKSICRATAKSVNVVNSVNSSDLVIEFKNGSEIQFLSGEQGQNLRGWSVSNGGIFCIDEASYIKDSTYDTCRPFTDFAKSTTVMVSTPFIADGFFYRHYVYGLESQHNTVTIEWKTSNPKYKEDLDRILSPEQLAEYKAILPKNVYLTEYEAEFISGTGMVFEGFRDVVEHNEIQPTDRLYVGIDFSNQVKADYTCVSIFREDGKQVYIWYANDLSSLKQVDAIYHQLEPYLNQIVSITVETNSLGTPLADLLKEKLPDSHKLKLNPFTTSNKSKNELVTRMQVALESKSITLLDDEDMLREFSYFAADYNPTTKNISYSAPTGLNDDKVMATLFALYAVQENNQRGVYSIGSSSVGRQKSYKYKRF